MEERKTLLDGSTLIRTEEGIYFHQLYGVSFPLLISEEDGERLWYCECDLERGCECNDLSYGDI
jgi:hypothetical protein